MMDMTVRELDAFFKGHDRAQRANMATALWAQWNGAVFIGHVWAGKRLPDIDARIKQIMGNAASNGGDVASVITKMRELAKRANLPPPKARKTGDGIQSDRRPAGNAGP